MEKRFRDLKEGDIVFIIEGEEIVEKKVKGTRQNRAGKFYVYTSHICWPYCGWPNSKRAGYLFVNEEDAIKQLEKLSETKKVKLEKKIDRLVSEFQHLDSISPPTVFPTTKPPSMKELKPGDSVWEVRKGDKEVREVKVNKIIKEKEKYLCYKVLYIYMSSSITFKTYPNSTRSINCLYYTGEEQAWRYMLDWKKSRMCTVGKEMEKLMKELERYEKVW